jgi:exopolysaccharide biosynthesis protein
MRFWDRVAGFIIVLVLVTGCFCLGLEYVIIKGPSPALRDMFINTMNETRRFRFIPRLFLTEEEMQELTKKEETPTDITTDANLITIAAHEEIKQGEEDNHTDAYGLVDEDGDGIILLDIKGNGYMGYMTVILDPKRVFVGMPDNYGGIGLTLEEMVKKYGAIGGINAGGFKDDGGGGLGGIPEGLTIVDGQCYNDNSGQTEGFAGLDTDGVLHVGFYTLEECQANNIINAVSFGPILITNGLPADPPSSSVNPRTAIGQRADGAILMLVIDGRQVHSTGATYQDMTDIMLDYGAINAINMDGGSSTVMYYKDHYVNSCSAENGQPRPLPDAWLYK